MQFDLASALTKKETRVIRKAEYMIPYHMARCPNYGWKESEEFARAEELKEKIAGIGAQPPNLNPKLSPAAPPLTRSLAYLCPPPPLLVTEIKAKKRWEANFV